jgi:hypothetical protein
MGRAQQDQQDRASLIGASRSHISSAMLVSSVIGSVLRYRASSPYPL